jgi:hypothetical protein
MPWELGFKDGENSRVAVLPIAPQKIFVFKGQQYLGIYPYVSTEPNKDGNEQLWINHTPTCYVRLNDWLDGTEPYERK